MPAQRRLRSSQIVHALQQQTSISQTDLHTGSLKPYVVALQLLHLSHDTHALHLHFSLNSRCDVSRLSYAATGAKCMYKPPERCVRGVVPGWQLTL